MNLPIKTFTCWSQRLTLSNFGAEVLNTDLFTFVFISKLSLAFFMNLFVWWMTFQIFLHISMSWTNSHDAVMMFKPSLPTLTLSELLRSNLQCQITQTSPENGYFFCLQTQRLLLTKFQNVHSEQSLKRLLQWNFFHNVSQCSWIKMTQTITKMDSRVDSSPIGSTRSVYLGVGLTLIGSTPVKAYCQLKVKTVLLTLE